MRELQCQYSGELCQVWHTIPTLYETTFTSNVSMFLAPEKQERITMKRVRMCNGQPDELPGHHC